jgi:hypothetical protein
MSFATRVFFFSHALDIVSYFTNKTVNIQCYTMLSQKYRQYFISRNVPYVHSQSRF